jgi:hypothetical protein
VETQISLHGRQMHSIFELLGTKENDITYSLGWALAESKQLCNALISRLFSNADQINIDRIELQSNKRNQGITDIELLGSELHVIIEAKRGWNLPTIRQLELYTPRFERQPKKFSAVVTMSECSSEYAQLNLPISVDGFPVIHIPWKEIAELSCIPRGTHAEKRLLGQLRTYLSRVVKMQNQESNQVYVVSLSSGKPDWLPCTWVDIVQKHHSYFHPVGGNGWPKEPPNYIGFRYNGKLQSIHHIEKWKIFTDLAKSIDGLGLASIQWPPHFVYTLGPAIVPPKVVKSGKVYRNGRVWASLDLLLTCDTVSEARDITQKRQDEN